MKTVYSIKFEDYHHFSGLNIIAEVNFWSLLKTFVNCDFFHNNNNNNNLHQLLQKGFLRV